METISDLSDLLRNMNARLHPEPVAFCLSASIPESAIVYFREAEGLTVIIPQSEALALGLEVLFRAAWITLTVASALEAVGFLASVTTALASAGIPCNAVSAIHHDHLFVPFDRGGEALALLQNLQAAAAHS